MAKVAVSKSDAPTVTQADLVAGLKKLGLTTGDSLMVHCALSAFGNVQGGPNALIDAILEIIGPKATLVFPTFTGVRIEKMGMDVMELKPFTGIVPATARAREDFIKGKHPLYSICAKGPHAKKWVEMEDKYIFPSAEKKFLYDMAQVGAKVALLGCSHEANSTIHVACELARLEYKIQDIAWWDVTVAEFLALPREKQSDMMDTHMGFKLPYGIAKHFDAIEWPLVQAKAMTIARIGLAECRLMRADDLIRITVDELKKNPWLFCDRLAKADDRRPDIE